MNKTNWIRTTKTPVPDGIIIDESGNELQVIEFCTDGDKAMVLTPAETDDFYWRMKKIMKTKYELGDKVWIYDDRPVAGERKTCSECGHETRSLTNEWKYTLAEVTIIEINIRGTVADNIVSYRYRDSTGYIGHLPASYYDTKEAAQAAVDALIQSYSKG